MTLNLEVMETEAFAGNMSRYGIEDGRTFAWLVGQSPNTPWIPPGSGETQAARFIQSNVGQDWWFDFYLNIELLNFFSRFFNFHTIAGYPEWFCGGATSPVAMDLLPIGELDAGTDGTNGRRTHTKPCYQFQVWGGGSWNSADQCFHDVPKKYYQFDTDLNVWHYVRGHINPQSDSTGYLTVTIDGAPWFDHHGPVHWPGVPGLVGGNSGMDLFEGLYEAVDVPSAGSARAATLLQRDGRIKHTISRWGHNVPAMLADAPTWRTHDSSIIVPGVGSQASLVFDTGTTIPDTGGGISGSAPAFTAAPSISGTPQVGGILGVSQVVTSGTLPITFTYVWERSFDNGATSAVIGGATAQTYSPVSADVGAILRLTLSATNAFGGPVTARTAYTVPVRAQGTATPLLIGKQTVGLGDGVFLGPDRERENSFFLPSPGQLTGLFMRLDGLAAPTGTGLVRLALRDNNGDGEPAFLQAISATVSIPAGTQPGIVAFVPTTFPIFLPQHLWLVCQTGGDPVVRAYLDAGVGLLPNVPDLFADGLDNIHDFSTYSIGDGVMTIWATFAPVAFPFEALVETHGGITANVFRGNDGGAVSYGALDSAASDAARAALCNAVNPSMLHTVHQRAASDYAFHARVPSAPAPPANWWL